MPTELIVILIVLAAIAVSLIAFKVWHIKRKQSSVPDIKSDAFFPSAPNQAAISNNEIAIANIESLILKGGNGFELALTRPNSVQSLEKKYREICVRGSSAMGQIVQGAMPVLAQAQTLGEIAKAAPNGLFTATAPIQDLMKLSGGTVGSAVMKDGKIAAQAGFAEVALNAANPVAVVAGAMQAMALISGQYYMNEISKRLESIDSKLDRLIGYHHDEKVGLLRSVNRELSELASKINVDAADIISCQRLEEKCGEVYFEYLTRLESVNVGAKERWINKPKELRELGASIKENELDFSIQMCYQASALHEKCKLAEIAIRLKIGGGQERFIAEQTQNLRKISGDSFHRNIHRHIDERYAPVLEKAEKIAEAKTVPLLFGDAAQESSNIQRKKEAILEIVAEDENGDNLAHRMLQALCEPQETLILLGETPDTQSVFVLNEEEITNRIEEDARS